MYVPPVSNEAEERALRAVLHANQFPADAAACGRTLLLWDDAPTAGLGYSARLIALALLVATRERRVLINVAHQTGRWCGRPPHTLGCFYEPWTHCPTPNVSFGGLPKWSTRGASAGYEGRIANSAPHVRISTSQIHKSIFWYKFHPPQALFEGTHELLFRPRSWVREAAHCVMRAHGLRGGNYVVVHARYSSEKKRERGGMLPPLSAYLEPAAAMVARANVSRLFLQTSNPEAVELFRKWARERGVHLSFTQNERAAGHDLWADKTARHSSNHSGERASVVAQTVNALIASRSRRFFSPSSSMWTWFVRALMGRRVGDAFRDSGGDAMAACFDALATTAAAAGKGNVTHVDKKRCRYTVPKLLEIGRVVPEGAAARAVDDEGDL